MTKETRKRKAEHIKIALNENVQAKRATTGFEDVFLIHRALPEIDKQKINLSTTVFGHKFAAPIIVGAITGGTSEATKINAVLAQAVEELGLGMGVGSQRAAIEDKKLEQTFKITRKKASTAFLIANIGGVQLTHGYSLKEAKKAIEMIDADALAIHLNPLQEAVQPEGQTNFRGVIEKIGEIAKELDKPVIVKETGAGIAAEEAKRLEALSVKGIDVSGAGGTSFAAVEYYRAKGRKNSFQRRLGDVFWDWGIPTAVSIVEVSQSVHIPVIASGGIREGLDVAKSLALGASLTSLSQPILETAVKGLKETKDALTLLMEELRNCMFLVGADSIHSLQEKPLIIVGKTAEWLKLRGFNIESYARRGRS
ncbi:MAG: type 2 isopentenyl-diphosphate Delta-isomerase [Candidatus Bathyarchaeota archaeon]|nr:type 2 isopentenyl-diphosphate Delta-isomerase [Candidatus Bathyarchaeota archaeon A05DMB-5]MDH7557005.1 type 2 isopentenyl-diphosphate Delta-isomerase [Candidatus Bathyarchaeota archaeon]